MPPPIRPHWAGFQFAVEEDGRPPNRVDEPWRLPPETCPELTSPQGHLRSLARSSCGQGLTPMRLPRRAVPDTSAPSVAFNTGNDAPSEISNTGVDLLHQATSPNGAAGGSWTSLMSEQINVDATPLSMPLHDIGSTQPKVAKAKRARNYTHEEDIQLCVSWENISTDPITGNEQPGMAYWKRIADHFHKHKNFESDRNANSLEHRWSTIQKECMRFQALYDDVERRHPSGMPYQEHILEAQTTFAKTGPEKPFQFLHCWLKVRHCQKFLTLETNKRPWSRSSTPSEGATEEEGDGGGRSDCVKLEGSRIALVKGSEAQCD